MGILKLLKISIQLNDNGVLLNSTNASAILRSSILLVISFYMHSDVVN